MLSLGLFSLIGGHLKSIGWRGWLIIVAAALVIFLWIRGNRFKGQYNDQLDINHQLEWEKSLAVAKFDSLKGIGEYLEIPIDTVPVPYPVPGPGHTKYDTMYVEAGEVGPRSAVISQVRIDTSKWFGPEGEKFGVRVYGIFHWPPEFSYRNRLLIDPLGFEKPPTAPLRPHSKNWGIGLAMAYSSQQCLYGGASVAIKRSSVFGMKSLSGSSWMVGFQYRLLLF